MNPKLIILNGVSSSGKTCIAKAFQDINDAQYLYLSLDEYITNASLGIKTLLPMVSMLTQGQKESFSSLISAELIHLFHHSIFSLYNSGCNVLVDTVFQEFSWLKQCVDLFKDENIIFIGIKCPLDVLEKRERDRSDRQNGLVKYQYDVVHKNCLYDLELDTSEYDPMECALKIRSVEKGEAFRKMKSDNSVLS